MKVKELSLVLDNVGNPDFGQAPDRRLPGTWRQEIAIKKDSLDQIHYFARKYIDLYELGGGNFIGKLYKEGDLIARVSYNGRIWDADTDREILIADLVRHFA